MRHIMLVIERCEDCPYYQYDARVSGKICKFREESPFALMRTENMIDDRCELPEFCSECGNPFDDNPGEALCKTCEEWFVVKYDAPDKEEN